LELAGGQALPVPLHARDGRLILGLGDRLVVFGLAERPEVVEVVEVGREVVSLCGPAPGTRPRLAVAFREGGLLYQGTTHDAGLAEAFASDMANPVVGFTGAGDLVAAC